MGAPVGSETVPTKPPPFPAERERQKMRDIRVRDMNSLRKSITTYLQLIVK